MKKFIIISDSTCDLNKQIREKFDIEMIKAHFMDKDGTDHFSVTDYSELDCYPSASDFYKALKANPLKFSTAAPSIPEMVEALKKHAKEGNDILIFTISSVMSGTYNFYNTAKEEVLKEYPDTKIYIVDTLRFGPSIGLMEINASILRDKGLSIEEVYKHFEDNKSKYHQMGWLDDLSFVAKKGRITHAKAFFGQLIGIKPLGECDNSGLTTVLGKAKGEKNAFPAMINYIKQVIVNPSEQVIIVAHSEREKQAMIYKELIEKEFNPKEVFVVECGPSIGINVGPGLLSAFFVGKELSEGLVEETKIMEDILA